MTEDAGRTVEGNPRGPGRPRNLRTWLLAIRPHRKDVKADVLAGLPGAISSVPDGMATALLAGVNPAYGLYASFSGKIGGGLTASTKLMVVTTTTAASLAAASALADVAPQDRDRAIITLTILTGILMVAAGVLHLGRYIRFVSRSVMLGFLTGVGVNIVLGQMAGLLGSPTEGGVAAEKAWYVITHPNGVNVASAIVGVAALAAMFLLNHTRIALFASLIAVVIPTVVVAALNLDDIQTVADVGAIPSGLPPLVLPHLNDLTIGVISGAFAIAAITLVQGAGVAESAPNRGKPSDTNRDFIGQGIANLASGFFHGTPVGGSVSSTALNIAAGARSRWASIFAGVWMLIILVAFSGVVGLVPMPTLAAVLIFAAVMSLRFNDMGVVWKTSHTGKIGMLLTFIATLALPVAAAVAVGVICSLLLQLNREQIDLKVVRLTRNEAGLLIEQPAPAVLPDAEPVMLDVYGSLLYAGARTLGAHLPDPRHAKRPVVILRLRGRTSLGSTFFGVIAGYADALDGAGGRLYLSGVQQDMIDRFHHSQVQDVQGKIRVFHATEVIEASTLAALEDAQSWLIGQQPPVGPAPATDPDDAAPD